MTRTGMILTLAAALTVSMLSQQARGDVCMEDRYFAATGGHLNCTANDVRIARVTNITDPDTGSPVTSCIAGQDLKFQADFEVVLTAQARYDIGLYLATDGDLGDGALTGQCARSIITPVNAPATFLQLDQTSQPADVCGDINAVKNPQIVHMQITTKCVAGTNNQLALPNCTSWRQPGSNGICLGVDDAYPGSPSKCNCDKNFTIPVIVEQPQLLVIKSANPSSVYEPGAAVEFTFAVTNSAQYTSVTLTSLVDDPDNDPATPNSQTYDALSNPSLASICQKTLLGPGETTLCTFPSRIVYGEPGQSITDKACASGTDSNGYPVGPACATASVSIMDVKPTAAVVKSLQGLKCAVVSYKVDVVNTDPVEELILTKLEDAPFGLIQVGGKIVATTCTVPTTIAAGATYSCTFDATVCGTDLSTVITSTDTVTATLNDNDGNEITPASNTLKVTVTAQQPTY